MNSGYRGSRNDNRQDQFSLRTNWCGCYVVGRASLHWTGVKAASPKGPIGGAAPSLYGNLPRTWEAA